MTKGFKKGNKYYKNWKNKNIPSNKNWKKKYKGRKGKKNYNWLGGVSKEKREYKKHQTFKQLINERDVYTCLLCRKTKKELKKYNWITVHHINYDKKDNNIENGITLCSSCHSKTNFNRYHWIVFFNSILKEKYGYNKLNKNTRCSAKLLGLTQDIVVEEENGRFTSSR